MPLGTLGGIYNSGSVTATHGSTAVAGTGVTWRNVVEGDLLFVPSASPALAMIDSVNGTFDGITLKAPWAGASGTFDGPSFGYYIAQTSWKRVDTGISQEVSRDILDLLAGAGIIYYVTGAAPDPGLGEDGQFAVRVNNGVWTFWVKQNGVWVSLGSPVGVNPRGPWSAAANYNSGDVVGRNGATYVAILPSLNKPPEANPSYWLLLTGPGNRCDLGVYYPVRPSAGEVVFEWEFTVPVTFSAGLAESRASAQTAANASAAFALQKNGTQFGTLTFAAGSAAGALASAADVTFQINDVLSVIGPTPQDSALRGLRITLTGYR